METEPDREAEPCLHLQPSLESSGKPQDGSSRKGADSHHVFYEDDTYWYFFLKIIHICERERGREQECTYKWGSGRPLGKEGPCSARSLMWNSILEPRTTT